MISEWKNVERLSSFFAWTYSVCVCIFFLLSYQFVLCIIIIQHFFFLSSIAHAKLIQPIPLKWEC